MNQPAAPSTGARVGRAVAGAIFLFISGIALGQAAWLSHMSFFRLSIGSFFERGPLMPLAGIASCVIGFVIAKSGRGLMSIVGLGAGLFAILIAVYGVVEKQNALVAFSGVLDIGAAVGMAMNDDPAPTPKG